MNIREEILQYDVSRETFKKIEDFVALLTEWNSKMNLISKNSVPQIWERHVLDSLQLIKYLPEQVNTLVDIGSGSGFPAIILALVLQEKRPQVKIVMIESITKKTVYLKDVCAKLNLNNVEIINDRVENVKISKVDIATARAVAALNVLCEYGYSLKVEEMLLLKGKSYLDEVAEAEKYWSFKLEKFDNRYSQDGVILKINNIRKKK